MVDCKFQVLYIVGMSVFPSLWARMQDYFRYHRGSLLDHCVCVWASGAKFMASDTIRTNTA